MSGKNIKNIRKPNIGDMVYIAPIRFNRNKKQYEAAVKKVGNKYFYTNSPHFGLAFEINNYVDGGWYEKPDSTYGTIQWKAYISREIYEKQQEKKPILQILKSDSMLDRPYKQIMALAEVLEIKFELEEWEI